MHFEAYQSWARHVPEEDLKYAPATVKVWARIAEAGGWHTAEALREELKLSRNSVKRALAHLSRNGHVTLIERWTRGGRKSFWHLQLTLHDDLLGGRVVGPDGRSRWPNLGSPAEYKDDHGKSVESATPWVLGDHGKGSDATDHGRPPRSSWARGLSALGPCHDRSTGALSSADGPSGQHVEEVAPTKAEILSVGFLSLNTCESSSGGEAPTSTNHMQAMGGSAGARASAAPTQTSRPVERTSRNSAEGGGGPSKFARDTSVLPRVGKSGAIADGTFAGWVYSTEFWTSPQTEVLYTAFVECLIENGDELPRHPDRHKVNIAGWLSQDEEIQVVCAMALLFHKGDTGRYCDVPGNPVIFEQKLDSAMRGSAHRDSDDYRWAFSRLEEALKPRGSSERAQSPQERVARSRPDRGVPDAPWEAQRRSEGHEGGSGERRVDMTRDEFAATLTGYLRESFDRGSYGSKIWFKDSPRGRPGGDPWRATQSSTSE